MEIRIRGLRKHYVSEGRTIKALDDVDLKEGDPVTLILAPDHCFVVAP